jgi:tRNA pseudouridine38-40 synthase
VTSLRRLKLIIEYDGTDFAGFQLQGQGERTVQGVIEKALSRLCSSDIVVHGAGRTDSGVHARGQVVHFDAKWPVPVDRTAAVLNGALPPDVSVRRVLEVSEDFHARFSAKQRTYIYLMWTGAQRSALWGRYTGHEPRALDVDSMSAAARMLQTKRDFSAFANRSVVSPSSNVRDLRRFEIKSAGNGRMIVFKLTADGFLRTMVRNLVGGLRLVGLGALSPNQLWEIAETKDRVKNPCPAAPPSGLCLWRVDY